MSIPIEDYALIGDCETAALVSREGSIDWLCWPRFDSAACFAALLGGPEHGRWLIAPCSGATRIARRYVGSTLVLETTFTTQGGEVAIVDFMPPRFLETDPSASELVRLVIGRRGAVPMRMELVLRFDYGASVPWVQQLPDGSGIGGVAGPDCVLLRSPVKTHGENKRTIAEFDVRAGETVPFVLTHQPSHLDFPAAIDPGEALKRTKAHWATWARGCNYEGPWREPVVRSLITLKALTYRPTGGIVAAPTSSLPEKIGGVRNWDYRYCWIRDATLTLLSLMHTGYFEEAEAWRRWLLRAAAGSPEQMQIMYGLAGERRLPEWEVGWLPGYEGSRPVRIGNAAHGQLQLDVYGELMDALYQGREGRLAPDDDAWSLQRAITEHLTRIWREPDEGIWETRGGRQRYTHSKVMAWVAVDRAIRTVEKHGVNGPVDRWRRVRDEIHADVCRNGFNRRRGCFVQTYGGDALDASLLLMPLVGFLPIEDGRVRATAEAVQRELTRDGLVLRYDTAETRDGLPCDEGVFLACSFWLVDNLVLQGKHDQAVALFERLLALRNDVGLLSEEYDPRGRRLVGNFPQAFSHVSLVNTANNLTRAHCPATQRAAARTAA